MLVGEHQVGMAGQLPQQVLCDRGQVYLVAFEVDLAVDLVNLQSLRLEHALARLL